LEFSESFRRYRNLHKVDIGDAGLLTTVSCGGEVDRSFWHLDNSRIRWPRIRDSSCPTGPNYCQERSDANCSCPKSSICTMNWSHGLHDAQRDANGEKERI